MRQTFRLGKMCCRLLVETIASDVVKIHVMLTMTLVTFFLRHRGCLSIACSLGTAAMVRVAWFKL